MAEIGKATLTIVPKLPGLDAAVKGAFSKVDAESIGEQAGRRYSGGIARTGAVAGAFAAVTSRALSAVAGHIDSAISRFDTLNNYPRVMDALGYSSDQVDASLSRIDSHLQGLPTALNSMVSTVQGISAITGDLGKATDAGLAVNDMLLAGGGSAQVVNAALEQFRQVLAKGKPELEDWKALTNAAPGQMAQLARAMLGPTASAQDLYAALGGGKNDPILTIDEFMDAIIRLDSEGSDGMKSFAEQAREATGGVQTSIANINTAMARGIANLMDTVGQDSISGAFADLKAFVDDTFAGANDVLADSMPLLKDLYAGIKDIAPAAIAGGAGMLVFKGGVNAADKAAERALYRIGYYSKLCAAAGRNVTGLGKVTAALGGPFGVATAAIGIGAAAVGFIADQTAKAREKQEDFEKSTVGLRDAVANATALDAYRGKVDGIGQSAGISAKSVEELAKGGAEMVDAMASRNSEAQNSIGMLNSAQQAIEDSIGKTDLSAEAQGRLEWAIKLVNDQLGLNISAQDVLNGTYADQDGNVKDLTQSIDELVAAKKREIEMDVLAQDYADVYKQKRDADKTLAAEYGKVDWGRVSELEGLKSQAAADGDQFALASYQTELDRLTEGYRKAKEQLEGYERELGNLEADMGDAARATGESGDALADWADSVRESAFRELADANGGFDALIEDMRNLGVDAGALKDMSSADLLALAAAYDGTALSIAAALAGVDGAMGEAQRGATRNARLIRESLEGINAQDALAGTGITISDLATAMESAGLRSRDLKFVTSEQFAELAAACGGSMGEIIAGIAEYNGIELEGKEAAITVDREELRDANGEIYTFNDGQLLDKKGNVVIETKTLLDADGKVAEWNGRELKRLEGSVDVDYSSVSNADSAVASLFGYDGKTVTLNIATNGSGGLPRFNAAGGMRLNAAGGYRLHAAGAIATKPTVLDIVGEKGGEAIVPLTNKRYSRPFARTIAEEMQEASAPAPAAVEYNIYLDGRLLAGFGRDTTLGTLADVLERKAAS